MAAIDIGTAAIGRNDSGSVRNTRILEENPANADGVIDTIKIWANTSLVNCEVATFFELTADRFSTRDYEAIGGVPAGSEQTFTGLNMDVLTADHIGIYGTDGLIEIDWGGSYITWTGPLDSDRIPCTDLSFTRGIEAIVSLYGTGEEAPSPGWAGKLIGVTNPAKIMGIDVTNIVKVNGVA